MVDFEYNYMYAISVESPRVVGKVQCSQHKNLTFLVSVAAFTLFPVKRNTQAINNELGGLCFRVYILNCNSSHFHSHSFLPKKEKIENETPYLY